MKIIARLTTILLLAIALHCHGQSAGPDQFICANGNVTMAGTGTGTWTAFGANPASVNINNPASASTTVAGFSISGTYTFFWNTSGGVDTIQVHVNALPSLTGNVTNTRCYGDTNGSICITAIGTAPFTYIWSNSTIGACNNNLAAGGYCITVTDANGCVANYCGSVTQPSQFGTTESHVDVTCYGGATGQVTLTAYGGTQPYNYQWSSSGIGPVFPSLTAGTYEYTVTDQHGCSVTDSVTIAEPASAFNVSPSHVDVQCHGAATGSIALTLTGGTTAYGTVTWSDMATGTTRTGLVSGTYGYTVSDANGCQAIGVVYITEPAVATEVYVSNYPDTIITPGDSLMLTAIGYPAGGTYMWTPVAGISFPSAAADTAIVHPPVSTRYCAYYDLNGCTASSYQWIIIRLVYAGHDQNLCLNSTATMTASGSGTWSSFVGNPTATFINSPSSPHTTISGFTQSGVYSFRWSTAAGDDTVNITVGTAIVLTDTSHHDAGCGGANDGSVCVSATGGFGGYYAYTWNPGGSTVPCMSGLAAGVYTLTAWDNNGCSATLSDTIRQSSPATVTFSASSVTCYGDSNGSISVVPVGGGGGWVYVWGQAPSGAGLTGNLLNGLHPGQYCVTVTDTIGGCTIDSCLTITEPAPLAVTDSIRNITCYGSQNGRICLYVTGGTPGYMYVWNAPGGNHTNSCIDSLVAGNYSTTITDNNGCSVGYFGGVITQPSSILVSASITDATCYSDSDGSIILTITGGVLPYDSVRWDWGPFDQTLPNVPAGVYAYMVRDANGCGITDTAVVGGDSQIVFAENVHNATCFGNNDGSICLNVTGGSPVYTYNWGGQLPPNGCPTGAAAGTYTVVVTDAFGCSAMHSVMVTEPAPITLSPTITDVLCYGGQDGSFCENPSGGTGPYTYQWSNFSIGQCQTALSAGMWRVIVTDSNGCTVMDSAVITEPPVLQVIDSIVNAGCGSNTGAIYATVYGGVPPYQYTWNTVPGIFIPELTTASGTYTLTVTDMNGCSKLLTDSILMETGCVWPGDADNNLLVDNNDLLPIGLGYDTTGPIRSSVSIVWQAASSTDWAQYFGNYTPALNYKYADCNGDGVINSDDTLAIVQNFGLTHTKTNASKPWRAGLPEIYPVISKDTITNGDTLQISINAGEVSLLATNVYGLAFDINYDAAVVDTTQTSMTFDNSWLGNASDKIAIYKDLKSQGVIKVGITRIDHTTRSGQGTIAHMRAIVTTDNIDGKNLSYYGFRCSISGVQAINATGQVIDMNEGVDSNEVAYTPTNVESIDAQNVQVSIYPNPANNFVKVVSAKATITGVEITNVLGENAGSYTYADRKKDCSLDMHALSSGLYYLSIRTTTGTLVRKVTVSH